MIVYHRERRRDHGPYCPLSIEGPRSRPDLAEPGEDRPGTPAGSGGSPACSDGSIAYDDSRTSGTLPRPRRRSPAGIPGDRRRDGRKKGPGRPTPPAPDSGGGNVLSRPLDRNGRPGRSVGRSSDPCRPGRAGGPQGSQVHRLSPPGPAWLAQGRPGHKASQGRSGGSGRI